MDYHKSMASQLSKGIACAQEVACSKSTSDILCAAAGTRGTCRRSTLNDCSFNFLYQKLMLIIHCHFENNVTSSLEFRFRRVISGFEANEPNFLYLCLCWTTFHLFPHLFLSFDPVFLKASGGLRSIVLYMPLLEKRWKTYKNTNKRMLP